MGEFYTSWNVYLNIKHSTMAKFYTSLRTQKASGVKFPNIVTEAGDIPVMVYS